jgi:hypothetical protein
MRKSTTFVTGLSLLGGAALAAGTIALENPSFETGAEKPDGWMLSSPLGQWLKVDASKGNRAVSVTGNGKNSNYWKTGTLVMEPSTLYSVSFDARVLEKTGEGGCLLTGASFANRDLKPKPGPWEHYTTIVVSPKNLDGQKPYLRFGQWQFNGSAAFDNVVLEEVRPVYANKGSLELGQGERLAGYAYTCDTRIYQGLHCRALLSQNCYYNTNRWCFKNNSDVTYCHNLEGRKLNNGTLTVRVGSWRGGELLVEASKDGRQFHEVGTIASAKTESLTVPASLYPADKIWVRLSARKTDKDAYLEVIHYVYAGTTDTAPVTLTGRTTYVAK